MKAMTEEEQKRAAELLTFWGQMAEATGRLFDVVTELRKAAEVGGSVAARVLDADELGEVERHLHWAAAATEDVSRLPLCPVRRRPLAGRGRATVCVACPVPVELPADRAAIPYVLAAGREVGDLPRGCRPAAPRPAGVGGAVLS